MPYFIRARTYFRYAGEELARAKEHFTEGRYQEAISLARAAVLSALKALYAINYPQAPNGPPAEEELLSALDLWQDPELSVQMKEIATSLEKLTLEPADRLQAERAIRLASDAVSLTKKALGPLLPPLMSKF